MCRANHLADALAKHAARKDKLPSWALRLVEDSATFVRHQAARLGTATFHANNHLKTVTLDGGKQVTQLCRDSTAQAPTYRKRVRVEITTPPAQPPPKVHCSADTSGPSNKRPCSSRPSTPCGANKRAANAATVARIRQEALDEEHLARLLSEKHLTPRPGPTASARLGKVLACVRSKNLRSERPASAADTALQ